MLLGPWERIGVQVEGGCLVMMVQRAEHRGEEGDRHVARLLDLEGPGKHPCHWQQTEHQQHREYH